MVVAKKKIWSSREIDEARCSDLSREASCSPQVAALLLSRGVDSGEKAQRFLHPRLVHLLDPEVLPEIDKAAERIQNWRNTSNIPKTSSAPMASSRFYRIYRMGSKKWN